MSIFAPVILLGIAVLWFLLPYVPTILEIRRRSGSGPLAIDPDNDGEVRHFARRFKGYIEAQFSDPTLAQVIDEDLPVTGRFNDGTPFAVIGERGNGLRRMLERRRELARSIVLLTRRAVLPGGILFSRGIYAAADVECGRETVARSILGERSVSLREHSVVLRWLHAGSDLHVAEQSTLHGRASADKVMYIARGVDFQRLHASRIVFRAAGAPEGLPARVPDAHRAPLQPHVPGSCAPLERPVRVQTPIHLSPDCFMVDRDLEVLAGTSLAGNYVVKGKIKIGRNAHIDGSLKSNSDLTIQAGSTVRGSVVSGRDLDVGSLCEIKGPVIAVRKLHIRGGAQIGAPAQPTTVTAPSIRIELEVLVHGTVWAREHGCVTPCRRGL